MIVLRWQERFTFHGDTEPRPVKQGGVLHQDYCVVSVPEDRGGFGDGEATLRAFRAVSLSKSLLLIAQYVRNLFPHSQTS